MSAPAEPSTASSGTPVEPPRAGPPSVHSARVLVQALASLGVREVVLAPGSRSAPLAYAVAQAARGVAPSGVEDGATGEAGRAVPAGAVRDPNAPTIDLHVRIDERDAGFLALGLAKGARAQGRTRPVAVVTTSGTAVANLHPAVLEAHHSGLPLLLLTADRPHELRGVGANQTTDQVGLLAPAVRLTVDVPAPTGRPGEDRDLRHVVARAVAAALGSRTGDPGPVHLNLAFRDPLVPDGAAWPDRSRDGLTEVSPRGAADGPVASASAARGFALLVSDPTRATTIEPDGVRTVVVAGDCAGPVAQRVAEANDWPLLAEPSSGARGGPNAIGSYRLLLGVPALADRVQRVVVLGRPTLSRQVHALLARPDVQTLVIAPDGVGWPDAPRNAEQVLAEVPPDLLHGNLGRGVRAVGGDGVAWLDTWQRAGAELTRRVRDLAAVGEELTGPTVAAIFADSVRAESAVGHAGVSGHASAVSLAGAAGRAGEVGGAGEAGVAGTLGRADGTAPRDALVVGSSNPVRDLDLVADWDEAPLVLANRGLAGIDGTVSTAAGTALALRRPVRVLVGDLTFLHDVGGLLVGPLERRPDLRIVVANDDGGSIFAGLEHGEPRFAGVFERVFGTPHGADLSSLCVGYGVEHTMVTDADALAEALARPVHGISVVEARVDRAGRRELAARSAAQAVEVVAELLGPTG